MNKDSKLHIKLLQQKCYQICCLQISLKNPQNCLFEHELKRKIELKIDLRNLFFAIR